MRRAIQIDVFPFLKRVQWWSRKETVDVGTMLSAGSRTEWRNINQAIKSNQIYIVLYVTSESEACVGGARQSVHIHCKQSIENSHICDELKAAFCVMRNQLSERQVDDDTNQTLILR